MSGFSNLDTVTRTEHGWTIRSGVEVSARLDWTSILPDRFGTTSGSFSYSPIPEELRSTSSPVVDVDSGSTEIDEVKV